MKRLGHFLVPALCAFIVAPVHAYVQQPQRFYERKAEGWFWYAKEPEPVENIEEPEPPAPVVSVETQEPVLEEKPQAKPSVSPAPPLSTAWLRENMERYLQAAIDNPTIENVKAYLYLQRLAMDRAENFAITYQMATIGDPYLDETMRRPLAEAGSKTVDTATGIKKSNVLKEIGNKAGLFFFFRSDCPACEVQVPIVKALEQLDGFPLIPVSIDGKNLARNPFETFQVDKGQAGFLEVQQLPALFLATPKGEFMPLGQGMYSLSEIRQRIITQAHASNLITQEQFNATRPIMTSNNLADVIDRSGTAPWDDFLRKVGEGENTEDQRVDPKTMVKMIKTYIQGGEK